jgi:leucyl aminopeptidase
VIILPSTQFGTTPEAPACVPANWLAIGVWEDERYSGAAASLVEKLREAGDFAGKHLELVPALNPPGVAAERLLFVGLGKRADARRAPLHAAAAAAARHATGKKFETLAFAMPGPDLTKPAPAGLPAAEWTLAVGVGLAHGCQGPGVRKTTPTRFAPNRVVLVGGNEADLPRVRAEARALWLARELVNAPPCDLYPETFAVAAADAGRLSGFDVEVWDESRLAAERMGSLLGVARGSARPARLAILRYTGNPGGSALGLVGKGVTVDSGVQAVAELKLPVNVLGVLALVENMPGGKSMKLGDVLTARNGKTIEVLNTDAEGRLILADALCYAAEQTDRLVDFATLTGACLVALGTETSGLMTNDDAWGDAILAAVARAGERAWKLPMDASYDGLIKSKVADMRNTGGGRWAGAIAGGKFLEQFVGAAKWVHLDIAGPAWAESDSAALDSGGTGCMVRSIVEMALAFGERPV